MARRKGKIGKRLVGWVLYTVIGLTSLVLLGRQLEPTPWKARFAESRARFESELSPYRAVAKEALRAGHEIRASVAPQGGERHMSPPFREEGKVAIAVSSSASFPLGLAVALESNSFELVGLNPAIVKPPGDDAALRMLIAGKVDAALVYDPFALFEAMGRENAEDSFAVVGNFYRTMPRVVTQVDHYVYPNRRSRRELDPLSLAGAYIALAPDTGFYQQLLMERHGMPRNMLHFVPIPHWRFGRTPAQAAEQGSATVFIDDLNQLFPFFWKEGLTNVVYQPASDLFFASPGWLLVIRQEALETAEGYSLAQRLAWALARGTLYQSSAPEYAAGLLAVSEHLKETNFEFWLDQLGRLKPFLAEEKDQLFVINSEALREAFAYWRFLKESPASWPNQ